MPDVILTVSQETSDILDELAQLTGEPIPALLVRALESYRRQWVLDQTNAAFSRLRENPEHWREEQAERQAWDVTMADCNAR